MSSVIREDVGALLAQLSPIDAPQAITYAGVAGMLALLFRLVYRGLAVKDVEMVRLVQHLRDERDRATSW